MARRRSRLSRLLDVKPLAFASLRRLTAHSPRLRNALSFYPELAPLPDRIDHLADRRDYRIRLADPRFAPQLAALAPHNWDVLRPSIVLKDPFVSRIFIGTVRDVEVAGHSLTPIDRATAHHIAFAFDGPTNWNFAHPGPSRLRSRRVDGASFVLPPHRSYWHLLLEHLLPLIHAWRLRAWGDGPLAIVTRARRPPLIDAAIDGLRAEGADITIVTPSPFEVLRFDRLLVAVNHCWNAEHSYALPEAIDPARRVFDAAYRDRIGSSWSKRLFLTRGGNRIRQLENESTLAEGLRGRGFQFLDATWANHHEQIAAFSNADVVVGVHGAGLANAVFARPGATILELFPGDFRKTSVLHLCAEHGIQHRAVFGSPEGRNQAFSVHPDDVFAALDAIETGRS